MEIFRVILSQSRQCWANKLKVWLISKEGGFLFFIFMFLLPFSTSSIIYLIDVLYLLFLGLSCFDVSCKAMSDLVEPVALNSRPHPRTHCGWFHLSWVHTFNLAKLSTGWGNMLYSVSSVYWVQRPPLSQYFAFSVCLFKVGATKPWPTPGSSTPQSPVPVQHCHGRGFLFHAGFTSNLLRILCWAVTSA